MAPPVVAVEHGGKGSDRMMNVLLQTTIATTADDWATARCSLRNEHGRPLFNVPGRDCDPPDAPDTMHRADLLRDVRKVASWFGNTG